MSSYSVIVYCLFQEYYNTLSLACEPGRNADYGWVNWTVHNETPSLVYYQSYKDFGLGWKIHVVNEGEAINTASSVIDQSGLITTLIIPLALTLVILTGNWFTSGFALIDLQPL